MKTRMAGILSLLRGPLAARAAGVAYRFTAFALGAMAALWPSTGTASSDFSNYIGYTIAAKKTINGWVSADGEKKGDAFEGCDYGRAIIFDDGTYLRCNSYGYQYAYRPDAILLVGSGRIVMVVDGGAYDMSR